MPIKIYFSDFFGVSPEEIEAYGAFNISLVNDLPLFIDPFLLFNSEKDEYQALHRQIIDYLRFLRNASAKPGIHPGLLQSWFRFPEVKQNWLGYSLIGNQGSGLGNDFALSLNQNLYTVFANFGDEEVVRSSHLEKLCLIKEGVGKDNISDFTTNLIKEFLLNYTQTFALNHVAPALRKRVAIEKVHFNYDTQTWIPGVFDLPYISGDYIILTPKDILTKDDIWINRADIVGQFEDIVDSIPNDQLRAQINNYFLRALPEKHTKRDVAGAVSAVISQYPAILDYYIRFKEDHGDEARRVSEERVDEIETFFVRQVRQFVEEQLIPGRFYENDGNTYEESYARAMFLKDVIENKDGYRIFYTNGQPLKRESDLHILYRLTWFATTSDVNREVNNGRGPVDYKISRGSKDRTLVEFKLASNSQLKRNLEKQTGIYEKASDTDRSIKVILYFSQTELDKVERTLRDLGLSGDRNIILIDARADNKPSGSKA